jgi:hypothetical protein
MIAREYKRLCPKCNGEIFYKLDTSYYGAKRNNALCSTCYHRQGAMGRTRSGDIRHKMSQSQQERYANKEAIKVTSLATKDAMHKPNIRAKHIKGLLHSKWIKVRTDKGQLELMNKWNSLGFKFEANYQVHTNTDLFYIDCFDAEHGVILEYDSKYHKRSKQQWADLIRQQKIIDVLKPKVFWRYDSVNKTFADVYRSNLILTT